MSFAAAAGLVVTAGTAIYSGIQQKKEANKLAQQNKLPIQGVPPAELENQQIARQAANEGLPAEQYARAMQKIQRQQQTAIRSAADRRAGVGLIGSIQQNTNDAMADVDVRDANIRLQNKRQLLGVNSRVGAYQDEDFAWNKKQPYLRNYQYSQALMGAGNANEVAGFDALGGATVKALDGLGLFGTKKKQDYYTV